MQPKDNPQEVDTEVSLPLYTRDLLPFLAALYPEGQLRSHVAVGDERGALMYAGKLELIDELVDILREEEERAHASKAV